MLGFPRGSDGKSICLQCRRPGFNLWVGKIPWRRKWQPTSVLLPGKFHRQRSLVGYSPWGCKELDTTEQLHFFLLLLNMLLLFYVFLVFWLWSMLDLISSTRNQTRTPYIGRQSLNHWTTREVPLISLFSLILKLVAQMEIESTVQVQNTVGQYQLIFLKTRMQADGFIWLRREYFLGVDSSKIMYHLM